MHCRNGKWFSSLGVFLLQLHPFFSICKLGGNSIMIIKMEWGKSSESAIFHQNRATKNCLFKIMFSRWHSESQNENPGEDAKKKKSAKLFHFSGNFSQLSPPLNCTGAGGDACFHFSTSQVLQHKNYWRVVGNEFLLLLLLCHPRFHFPVWRLPSGELLSPPSEWPQAIL